VGGENDGATRGAMLFDELFHDGDAGGVEGGERLVEEPSRR
jgi:hypothetical protein